MCLVIESELEEVAKRQQEKKQLLKREAQEKEQARKRRFEEQLKVLKEIKKQIEGIY